MAKRECRTCWWLDVGTGICCHEGSETDLKRVAMDSVCPSWVTRDCNGEDSLPFDESWEDEEDEGR